MSMERSISTNSNMVQPYNWRSFQSFQKKSPDAIKQFFNLSEDLLKNEKNKEAIFVQMKVLLLDHYHQKALVKLFTLSQKEESLREFGKNLLLCNIEMRIQVHNNFHIRGISPKEMDQETFTITKLKNIFKSSTFQGETLPVLVVSNLPADMSSTKLGDLLGGEKTKGRKSIEFETQIEEGLEKSRAKVTFESKNRLKECLFAFHDNLYQEVHHKLPTNWLPFESKDNYHVCPGPIDNIGVTMIDSNHKPVYNVKVVCGNQDKEDEKKTLRYVCWYIPCDKIDIGH